MKVGFLPCAFSDSCSRDRNLVSPDVTVEQEALCPPCPSPITVFRWRELAAGFGPEVSD